MLEMKERWKEKGRGERERGKREEGRERKE